jgi:alanyl-tRNA synthetase
VLEDLGAAAERANAILAGWVAAGGSVRVVREDPALSARRRWVCALPAGVAEIPCGGTHVAEVGELAGISVTLRAEPVDGGAQVVMETETARRSG